MRAKVMGAGETAYLVRWAVGPVRSWGKQLEQWCRDAEAHFMGARLEPCGRMVRKGYPRPVYLVRDVIEFIQRLREMGVCHDRPGNPGAIEVIEVEIDTKIHCPWIARTVTPVH